MVECASFYVSLREVLGDKGGEGGEGRVGGRVAGGRGEARGEEGNCCFSTYLPIVKGLLLPNARQTILPFAGVGENKKLFRAPSVMREPYSKKRSPVSKI